MAILNRTEIIDLYNRSQSTLHSDALEINFSNKQLFGSCESFSYSKYYDIFLSHSYDDARIVKQIKVMLEDKGYSVYVDWVEDDHLDRGKVTESTAEVLRGRMDNCSSLIYLTSQSAENSKWMPWELGYMDAKTNKVSVAPILEDDEDFDGREYLGLYPYLDLTGDSFYIHRTGNDYVSLTRWMEGDKP